MKTVLALALALALAATLSSCVTDAAGNKHYNGPSVGVNFGFMGASIGVNLLGNPALPPVAIPVELPKPSGK